MNVAYEDDAVVIRLDAASGEHSVDSLARAIAMHLLHLRTDTCARTVPPCRPAGLASDKLEKVRAYVEQNLAEPLRTDHLAAVVHMSPFHFSRTFKRTTGESPHRYVMRRRIERAKALLVDEHPPLVHVAVAVGFQTQGHFTEVFRRYTGTTPRRFRLAAHFPTET
jgi:transcriptional regulator GlxA family with amidase domain